VLSRRLVVVEVWIILIVCLVMTGCCSWHVNDIYIWSTLRRLCSQNIWRHKWSKWLF